MEVVLDTNFIISCVKRKIDFVSQLESLGFKIVIAREVIDEMKDLRQNVKHDDRIAIDLAMQILDEAKLKKIKIGKGKVDDELIKMGNGGAYVASLDAYIKRSVPNKVAIDNASNGLMIERN
jgi:rRNA-processing protein FCF1